MRAIVKQHSFPVLVQMPCQAQPMTAPLPLAASEARSARKEGAAACAALAQGRRAADVAADLRLTASVRWIQQQQQWR